jgi:hypothetical protein
MADETTVTAADLMRVFRERLVINVNKKGKFLAEIRKDKSSKNWDGLNVEIPVVLSPLLQGSQAVTETGTVGDLYIEDTVKATVKTGIVNQNISASTQLLKQLNGSGDADGIDQGNDPRNAVNALKYKMTRAEKAIVMFTDEIAIGAGDGKLANITVDGASGLVHTVGAAANFFLLYRHRVVDFRNKSSGAVVASKRKITDVDAVNGTVTVDGANFATTAATDAIFIVNTGTVGAGNATPPQGVGQLFATSGTFQGVNVANYPDYRGTDASPASATDPTKAVFDAGERKAYRESGTTPDWYAIDPAVSAKYGDLYMDRVRWTMPTVKLATGFEGYEYKGKALIDFYEMPAKTSYGIYKDDITIYTLGTDGPDWDEHTGSMWMRFSRTLVMEAWLVWMYQMGFLKLNAQTKIGNLNQQASV